MYTITYQAQLGILNRFCTQSLENSQLLDEILGEQPITVSSNRGKRKILTTKDRRFVIVAIRIQHL